MTVILVSILLVAISLVYLGGFRAAYSQFDRSGIKGEAGRSFWNLAQELRQATSITTARARNLVFTLDANSDGIEETIQYTWSGTSGDPLNRVELSPGNFTIPVVISVQSFAFTYYAAPGQPLVVPVPPPDVRAVSVDITSFNKEETSRLRTEVQLRSR